MRCADAPHLPKVGRGERRVGGSVDRGRDRPLPGSVAEDARHGPAMYRVVSMCVMCPRWAAAAACILRAAQSRRFRAQRSRARTEEGRTHESSGKCGEAANLPQQRDHAASEGELLAQGCLETSERKRATVTAQQCVQRASAVAPNDVPASTCTFFAQVGQDSAELESGDADSFCKSPWNGSLVSAPRRSCARRADCPIRRASGALHRKKRSAGAGPRRAPQCTRGQQARSPAERPGRAQRSGGCLRCR